MHEHARARRKIGSRNARGGGKAEVGKAAPRSAHGELLRLQRAIGNRATSQLVQRQGADGATIRPGDVHFFEPATEVADKPGKQADHLKALAHMQELIEHAAAARGAESGTITRLVMNELALYNKSPFTSEQFHEIVEGLAAMSAPHPDLALVTSAISWLPAPGEGPNPPGLTSGKKPSKTLPRTSRRPRPAQSAAAPPEAPKVATCVVHVQGGDVNIIVKNSG